jgi:hypothetical protein
MSLCYTGDGATLDTSNCPDNEWKIPLESMIYVSTMDPLSEPAFKPGPTKPVPLWMQIPPGNRCSGLERKLTASSILYQQLARPSSSKLPSSRVSDNGHTRTEPSYLSPTPPLRRSHDLPGSPHSSLEKGSRKNPIDERRRQRILYVSNERLKQPSSRMSLRHHSQSDESAYMTPPEYPSRRTTRDRETHGGNSSRTGSGETRHSLHVRELFPAQSRGRSERTPPPQSTEYLERYRPGHGASSTMRRLPREQIIEKIQKNSRAELDRARVTEETAWAVIPAPARRTKGGEEASPNELGKRRHLHAELRQTFGGR